jgi:signal transduction histidine kinase
MSTDTSGFQKWLPDLGIGLGLGAFALAEALQAAAQYRDLEDHTAILVGMLTLGWAMAIAAGLYRRAPGVALLLVWLAGAYQVVAGIEIMLVELAVVVVAFGTARYGRTAVLWASGLSIPVGGLGAMVLGRAHRFPLGESLFYQLHDAFWARGVTATGAYVGLALVGAALLVVPWLVGLLLRVRAKGSETEAARQVAVHQAAQAQEIAALRDQQARMARDVHDVVGHSLAVILAQAESAQFLKDTDTAGLKKTMANIATSARTSLQDVRQVLSSTSGHPVQVRPGELTRIIEGVRASGHEVVATEVGAAQPLPPELDVVAVRVLQEMLTNAIKHGRRDQPVEVEQHWEGGDLRLEVRNVVDDPTVGDETVAIAVDHAAGLGGGLGNGLGNGSGNGSGVDGMRRRLDSVGGRLDVRRRESPDGATFTVTAWVPLRSTT